MSDSALRFVVFDCDGTLVDSQYGIYAAMCFAFEQAGLDLPGREAVNRQIGLPLQQGIANMAPGLDAAGQRAVAEGFHAAIYEHRIPDTQKSALFPHCRETLEQLHAEGYVMGIATGMGRRGLLQTVKEQGLEHLFTVLKSADDGPGKPNPAILLDAMVEVGADAADTVMVGDTVFDVQTGVNARTLALGVAWGYHEVDALTAAGASAIVRDFRDIPGVLNSLWAN